MTTTVKKKRKPLPKMAYLVWDEQTDGEHYLIAAESLDEHAEKGAKTVVGTYKLVTQDVVTLVTKISQRKLRI